MQAIKTIKQAEFKSRFIYNPDEQLLGKGGFAEVYEAYDANNGKTVALKIFTGNENTRYNLIREIEQLQHVPIHPNLIQYYEVLEVETGGSNIHGNALKQQIAVLEYANYKTLEELMQTHVPDTLRKQLLLDILQGLQHLHQHNIVHRDLKPRNILINNQNGKFTAKIADFGIAKALEQTDVTATQTSTGIIGTGNFIAPEQIAPEQFAENGKINEKLDVWSFGVLVYQWVTGNNLYNYNTTQSSNVQLINAVLQGVPKEQLQKLPQPYIVITQKCLVQKAMDRVGVNELIKILQGTTLTIESHKTIAEDIENKNEMDYSSITKKALLRIIIFLLLIVLGYFYYNSNKSTEEQPNNFDSIDTSVNRIDSSVTPRDTTKRDIIENNGLNRNNNNSHEAQRKEQIIEMLNEFFLLKDCNKLSKYFSPKVDRFYATDITDINKIIEHCERYNSKWHWQETQPIIDSYKIDFLENGDAKVSVAVNQQVKKNYDDNWKEFYLNEHIQLSQQNMIKSIYESNR